MEESGSRDSAPTSFCFRWWDFRFPRKIIRRADQKATEIGHYEKWGLFLFVAIPLPGTGAWTGSLVAAVLRMRIWQAFLVITVGVLVSGFITGGIAYGLFTALA